MCLNTFAADASCGIGRIYVPSEYIRVSTCTERALYISPSPLNDAERFLKRLHDIAAGQDGLFVLVYINPVLGALQRQLFAVGDWQEMAKRAVALSGSHNVYTRLSLVRADIKGTSTGKLEDLTCVLGLTLESDFDKNEIAQPIPGYDPDIIVESNSETHNRHLHYLFETPQSPEVARELARLNYSRCGGDSGGGDCVHLWRVPGTFNHPNKAKLKRGRSPEPTLVTLLSSYGEGGMIRDVAGFKATLESLPPRAEPKLAKAKNAAWNAKRAELASESIGDCRAILAHLRGYVGFAWLLGVLELDPTEGTRSEHAYSTVQALFERELSPTDVKMLAYNYPFMKKFRKQGTVDAEIARQYVKRTGAIADKTKPCQAEKVIYLGDYAHEQAERRNSQIDVQKDPCQNEEWPALSRIGGELLPVLPFDSESMLPEAMRLFVQEVTKNLRANPEYVAVSLIASIGALIGYYCGVRPKARDIWTNVPNLWGVVVSPPSTYKTPAIEAGTKPLKRLSKREEQRTEAVRQAWESNAKLRAARYKAASKKLDKLTEAGLDSKEATDNNEEQKLLQIMNENDPKAGPDIVAREYWTGDATPESVVELAASGPVLVSRDELMGLFASWNKRGHESARATYLEGYNGTGEHKTHRIGRGKTSIARFCVSVFGGTQPDRMIGYLNEAESEKGNDGFLARLQLMVYPDPFPWEYVDIELDMKIFERIDGVFDRLNDLKDPEIANSFYGTRRDNDADIRYLRFDDDAQQIFIDFTTKLHNEKVAKEANTLLIQHLMKYDRLMSSLALIFHLVEIADGAKQGPITAKAARMAADWCEFLESHARRIYGMLADNGLRAAQQIVLRIREHKLKDGFTARDIKQANWQHLREQDAVEKALPLLVENGYLREQTETGENAAGGRPTKRYLINPKIRLAVEDGC